MAVKLIVKGVKLSVISCYLPHAGYTAEVLDDTYEKLAEAVRWASVFSLCFIVGGDFSTQLHSGARSDKLLKFVGHFNLSVANVCDDATSRNNEHTFRSSRGFKRQIDFILSSLGFHVLHASATDNLDLGSDHRAVMALLAQRCNYGNHNAHGKRKQHMPRTWTATANYASNLSSSLLEARPTTLKQIEIVVVSTADVHIDDAPSFAFRDTQTSKNLRRERRLCRDNARRAELSKTIQKQNRTKTRHVKTQRIKKLLEQFRNISGLEAAHRWPVQRTSISNDLPDGMADLMGDLFASDVGCPSFGDVQTCDIP